MYSDTRFKKSALRNAVLLALSINGAAMMLGHGVAQADNQACAAPVSSDGSANFTMLNSLGGTVGGTNNVAMSWNGTAYTASSDYTGPGTSVANVTAVSTTAFFGHTWAAHDIQLFAPGSYSFDVTLGGGASETGILNVTVPAGQLGMHMLFDWNNTNNIDVFVVAKTNAVFGPGIGYSANSKACNAATITNCLWDYLDYGLAGQPTATNKWMLASVDGNADGIMGIPMPTGGPFAGFNANFNMRGTLSLTSGSVCAPTALPNQFTFTDVTGIQPNTLNVSNTITVSGLGGSVSAPMSIAGGEYSTDDGNTWASTNTTVQDNATVKVRQTSSANSDGTKTDTTLSISGVSDTYSVTVIDKKPNAFTFTDIPSDATVSTVYESNTITVGGMDTGSTAPISISSSPIPNTAEYSVSTDNGVNWSAYSMTVPATVANGNMVKVHQTSSANGAAQTDATLTLGQVSDGTLVSDTFSVRTAGGLNSTGNNFTMLDKTGGVTGGTNDVIMDWDQQTNTSTSDPVTPATAHMHLSSVTAFFGYTWTAHHIRVFGPGTYTINVDCTTAQLEAGTCAANQDPSKNYTFTVGANQYAAHMLFDWNTTKNIDVVDIWDKSAKFTPSKLFTGEAGCANAAQTWDYMSGDWDNDAQNGGKMIDGPFIGFSANFNLMKTTITTLTCGAYTPTVNVSSPSGAGGCSISPTPTHLQARADWWLVAGFLAWLGGIRLRFKRRQAKS